MWIPMAIKSASRQRQADSGSTGVSDSLKAEISGSEEYSAVKKVAPYGIAYVAPQGEESVVMPLGGGEVCVGVVSGLSENLNPGELMLYSLGGAKILLKNDGSVVINGRTFEKESG